MEKLPSCCGYRKVRAGMAWSDVRKYVRMKSKFKTLRPEEKEELARLKEQAKREREAFHAHMDDESLVHK
jgi:hypothetical protein